MSPRREAIAGVLLVLGIASCKSEDPNTCSNGAHALMCDGRDMEWLNQSSPTPTLHFTSVDVVEGGCDSPYCPMELPGPGRPTCKTIRFENGALPNPAINGSTVCRYRAFSAEGPSVEIALEYQKRAPVQVECCCTGPASDSCAPALRQFGTNSWKVTVNGVLLDSSHTFESVLRSTVDAGVPDSAPTQSTLDASAPSPDTSRADSSAADASVADASIRDASGMDTSISDAPITD